MSLGDTIRHGAKWVFVGNTGSQIVNFALGLILARLLVPADFGMVATIQIFTGLAGFIAAGGMGQALVRAKEASKRDYDLLFTLQLLIGWLIFAGFFLVAPWFAQWYQQPLYADLLRVSAISFLIRPFFNVPANMLFREMRFKAKTLVQLANMLAYNAVSLSMAFLGYGPWSLIIAGLVSSVIGAALFARAARWLPGFCLDLSRARELVRYGYLVSANNLILYLRQHAPAFFLSRSLGPASVGLFDKAQSLASRPHEFITGSVYEVLFRALAKEQDNLDRSRYLFFRSLSLVAVYSLPFYVGMVWLARPLVVTVYGENWAPAGEALGILAFGSAFAIIESLSGAVLAARNWLDRELFPQVTMVGAVSAAILLGLPYGLPGVAAGLVLARLYMSIHMFWLAKTALKARWSDLARAFHPAFVLNFALVAALIATETALPDTVRSTDWLYVLIMTMVGGTVYGVCFLYLPLPALATEAQRWKVRLRLAPGAK